MDPEEQRRRDLAVRPPVGDELCDPPLGRRQPTVGRCPATHAAELGSRLVGPQRRTDELTTLEQRVAELAAEGWRNKEIAAAMYVTVATVEAHLSRVYRKLGVRSRAELASRFSRDTRSDRSTGDQVSRGPG